MRTFGKLLFLVPAFLMAVAPTFAAPLRISLDGTWLFAVDSLRAGITGTWFDPAFDRTSWRPVETPRFWEGYPGMATYDGWGWFARTITIGAPTEPVALYCAGIDDEAVVWINGTLVGDHSGYSVPFTLDVTPALRPGENTIVILVKDNGGGGGIYRPLALVAASALDSVLRGPYAARASRKSAPWVREGTIYSVYLRSASPEGTFAGFERRLPELRKVGVTVLWFLPIHPVGEKNRKGTLGSPYAVRDYYGINPEFGTMADFKHLLRAAHAAGMHVIIDLVANHTSWDSEFLRTHPEWFTRNAEGAIVPPNADWTDVADLDYAQRGLRDAMIEMMRWWVEEVGIDGFRCDVAEMVPTDFWDEARARLDRVKPVMMLSEGSIPEHHLAAFDLTYSWNVYDALDPLLTGQRPVTLLDDILRAEELQFPRKALRMRFTTNHDKNAWDAPAVEKFGSTGLALATVLVNTLPGVPMLYTGEEVANDRTLDLFEKIAVDWSRPREMEQLWASLFRLRREHPALRSGTMTRLRGQEAQGIYAFERRSGKDRVIVVLNFGKEAVTARVKSTGDTSFVDLLAGGAVTSGNVAVPGHGYRLLRSVGR
jgi:glycosidase